MNKNIKRFVIGVIVLTLLFVFLLVSVLIVESVQRGQKNALLTDNWLQQNLDLITSAVKHNQQTVDAMRDLAIIRRISAVKSFISIQEESSLLNKTGKNHEFTIMMDRAFYGCSILIKPDLPSLIQKADWSAWYTGDEFILDMDKFRQNPLYNHLERSEEDSVTGWLLPGTLYYRGTDLHFVQILKTLDEGSSTIFLVILPLFELLPVVPDNGFFAVAGRFNSYYSISSTITSNSQNGVDNPPSRLTIINSDDGEGVLRGCHTVEDPTYGIKLAAKGLTTAGYPAIMQWLARVAVLLLALLVSALAILLLVMLNNKKSDITPENSVNLQAGGGSFDPSNPEFKKIGIGQPDEVEHNSEVQSILVVDDSVEVLYFIQSALSGRYNIYTAKSGVEGLQRLSTIPKPDLIISDVIMGEMDGHQFFDEVNSQPILKDIPFIFLTARKITSEMIGSLQKGAIDYIYKPFMIDELVAKIGAVLLNRSLQKQQNIDQFTATISNVLQAGALFNGSHEPKISLDEVCEQHNISRREKQVLKLLLDGLINKEISSELDISVRTVEHHVHHIYEKMVVENRVELINKVRQST